jgi:8-oxo-dGTP pyrophosphatase MutT (NUDIX family)
MTLREQIGAYVPWNEQEAKEQEVILRYFDTFSNLLTRENEFAHLTGSSLLVNKQRDKTLMVYHNLYRSWSWTGGHADGDPDLLGVAMREAREETGVSTVKPVAGGILSLDILPVWGHMKRGRYVATHLHLSVCYLLEADEAEPLTVKVDENSGVRWVPLDEMAAYSSEPEMKPIYGKLVEKAKKYFEEEKAR